MPGAETLFELVEVKVERIEYPWISEGNINFIPTRIKWIKSMSNKKGKNEDKTNQPEAM